MPSFDEKLDDFLVRYLAYSNYKNYSSRINLKGDEKVLEVGSGRGNLSRFLAEKLHLGKLVCVDSSNYWINKARRRLKKFNNIEFIEEDILNFKRKNYFDSIVIHYILHDLEQKEKAVEIFKDSLKKTGFIYIREPTRKEHGISDNTIEDLFERNGFLKGKSNEGYSFPLKGKIYEGIFFR